LKGYIFENNSSGLKILESHNFSILRVSPAGGGLGGGLELPISFTTIPAPAGDTPLRYGGISHEASM
jgi:hypothetical protein